MNDAESSSQRDMVLRLIENEMLRFIRDMKKRWDRGDLTLEGQKEALAKIDAAIRDRDEMEKIASAEMLSPLYYEAAASLDALRGHFAAEIAKVSQD